MRSDLSMGFHLGCEKAVRNSGKKTKKEKHAGWEHVNKLVKSNSYIRIFPQTEREREFRAKISMSRCEQVKCFFTLVKKSIALRKLYRLYVREKQLSKAESANVNKCLCTKISGSDNQPGIKKVHCGSKKNSFLDRFFIEDSIRNFVLKSVLGFLGGIFLTYVCFMFLVFSLNFTLKRATYICMGLGVILSLGLAFSVKIRCTVFLCIPQLFSKRGRQALLAYAFILALSGPAKNTLHNVEVMSESLACGQEQIKQAENELLKCVQRPNAAAKKSVEKLLIKLNNAVKYFRNFVLQLYRTCFDVLETLLHAQKWLYSISLLCNKKMENPTERCQRLLIDSSENCQAVTDLLYWKRLCQFNPFAVQLICAAYESEFCYSSDVYRGPPIHLLKTQLDTFKRRAMNILYVRVNVHQTFTQSNRSNTFHEEYQGMATEIRQKTDQFLQYFDFMSVIFGIFILVLFVKVIIYRHKFLTEDHYDNRFITPDFVDIDNTRAEFQMETILPLKPREKCKYIKVTSIRLVPCEKIRLLSSFVFLIFATFKIIIHMLTDSSLYWILSSVRRDERLLYMSSLKEEEPGLLVRIKGNGMVAELFRNVSYAVERQYSTPKLDPTPCLPDPVSPDWNRYYQILALVFICWLLALFEPYGLRLRHTVMVIYHPDRARERAIWLYNRIISHRNSYVKIARREIRRKYKNGPGEPLFRGTKSRKCLLCKVKLTKGDNHVKCGTVDCVGVFCFECYSSLKYCSICTDPAMYGDLSDLSEEKDSSEEEETCKHADGKEPGARSKGNAATLMNIKKPTFEKSLEGSPSQPGKLLRTEVLRKALQYCREKLSRWEVTSQTEMCRPASNSDHSKSMGKRSCKTLIRTQQEDSVGSLKSSSERLIRTTSLTESGRLLTCGPINRHSGEIKPSKQQPKPDFRFKIIKCDAQKYTKHTSFLGVKDSKDIIRCKKGSDVRKSTSDDSSNVSNKKTSYDRERLSLERTSLRVRPLRKGSVVSLNQGRVRVCTKPDSSSDSPTDSYRFCSTIHRASSSSTQIERCREQARTSASNFPKGSHSLKRTFAAVHFDDSDHSSDHSARSRRGSNDGKRTQKDGCNTDKSLIKRTSKGKGEEKERKKVRRKSSRLSWAPDLLSDLPVSKKEGSGTSTDKD